MKEIEEVIKRGARENLLLGAMIGVMAFCAVLGIGMGFSALFALFEMRIWTMVICILVTSLCIGAFCVSYGFWSDLNDFYLNEKQRQQLKEEIELEKLKAEKRDLCYRSPW